MSPKNNTVLLVDPTNVGQAVIPAGTSLSRLNYYDGKVLRAADMTIEQSYLMNLVALSNHSLGAGVVHGFDTALAGGDQVRLGGGLAIDPQGHPLLLPSAVTLSIQDIINASKPRASSATRHDGPDKHGHGMRFDDCVEVAAPSPSTTVPVTDLYVLAICRAEAFCGLEDVYGKLCETACVTTTQRPYVREGVVVRMLPLQLATPFLTSFVNPVTGELYLRSQVAHSFFADEVARHPNALNRTGLLSNVWCLGSQYDDSCCEVPLAVISRAGGVTRFLDPWIARRERMDTPSRQYWQWRMRQRPWSVFLAQVLQFQCQLAHLLEELPTAGDPCAPAKDALRETATLLDAVKSTDEVSRALALLNLSFTQVSALREKLKLALDTSHAAMPTRRILINRGIIELPPAGYLPVVTGERSVNSQVRALLGEGLDLRFCVVRPDFVGEAFQEAQHLDRISLLQGLDSPHDKPRVDVLVPDGQITGRELDSRGLYSAVATFGTDVTKKSATYQGAAREKPLSGSGVELTVAAGGSTKDAVKKYATWLQPWVAARAAGTVPPAIKMPTGMVDKGVAAPGFYRVNSAELGALRTNANRVAWAHASSQPLEELVMAAAPAADLEAADAVWISARAEADVTALPLNERIDVRARGIYASLRPGQPPSSLEADFTGTLTNVQLLAPLPGQARRFKARLAGLTHLTVSFDSVSPANPSERLLTYATRLSLDVEVSSGAGHAELTFSLSPSVRFQLSRAVPGPNADVAYGASLMVTSASNVEVRTELAELLLKADAGILNPTHPDHVVAELALDVLQGTRLVTEPGFKAAAEHELFPELTLDDPGLVIRPMLDWVMFHRRRDKQCTRSFDPPAVQVLPRRYQVLNLTVSNADEATTILQAMADPARRAQVLAKAVKISQPKIFVDFAGGSAQALFQPADLLRDWNNFNPHAGQIIWGVAWGAVGDDQPAVQGARLRVVESALTSATVRPTPTNVPLSPYPADLAVAGADGIFLFVTVQQRVSLDVIEVPPGDVGGSRIAEIRAALGNANLRQLLARFEARYLGVASYVDTIPDGTSVDEVVAKWKPPAPSASLLWARAGDTQLFEQADSAKSVVTAIGARFPGGTPPLALITETTAAKPSVKIETVTTKNAVLFVESAREVLVDVLVAFFPLHANVTTVQSTIRADGQVNLVGTLPMGLTGPNAQGVIGMTVIADGVASGGAALATAYLTWAQGAGLRFPGTLPPPVVMNRADPRAAPILARYSGELSANESLVLFHMR